MNGKPSPSLETACQGVYLFTDIVGSVAMKQRFGDEAYRVLQRRHDDLFRAALAEETGGEIIKDIGDGFLACFQTPADAVCAALRFQHALAREPWDPEPVRVRIGLHSGTAIVCGVPDQQDFTGLAVDLAGRVMGLAEGGQVLLTRHAFDDARQYVREHPEASDAPDAERPPLQWKAHGPYVFKGAEEDDPVEVFEVGVPGAAPLRPPPDSEKAWRAVRPGEESMYDWRPAVDLEVPGRRGWVLARKLGEGGFGEVWLARHGKTREPRVFKFCFDADRLRSFKRELTLFRLLCDALGDRPDIAKLHEVNLDAPPYYLESEYSPHGDLRQWTARKGGLDQVQLDTRLDLVRRTAEALAAAHSVGVLHKDLKPSNILLELAEDGEPRPKLADFGIGVLTDQRQLQERQITAGGFTVSQLTENESSRTGTRMYAPPELLTWEQTPEGRKRPSRFTAQGDVYALGVLLYQMVIADLDRPLATGWERDVEAAIEDADGRVLLTEDIRAMVDGDPARRPDGAGEVAERLRNLDRRCEQRRRERAEREARQRAERQAVEAERRRRQSRRIGAVATVALALLLTISGVFLVRERSQLVRERSLRAEAEVARADAEAAHETAEQTLGLTNELLAKLMGGPDTPVLPAGMFDRRWLEKVEKLGDDLNDDSPVQQELLGTLRDIWYNYMGNPQKAEEVAQKIGERSSLAFSTVKSPGRDARDGSAPPGRNTPPKGGAEESEPDKREGNGPGGRISAAPGGR